MDHSAIPSILRALNLKEEDVSNIYHYGSWIYGSNTLTSDRDLLIVTRSSSPNPLKFWSDFDYFHDHQVHKLWNQYDISIYTTEEFEILLEKTFLIVVQCVFLRDEFKIKDEIDFRKIYLEKYFNPIKLKQSAFYEMYRYWKLTKPESASAYLDEKCLARRDYIAKHLFHGLRYLDFVEQIIQTQSIHDYRRVTYLYGEIKAIRDNPIDQFSMERVIEFVRKKEAEFKARLDVLVPTNIIKGTFEALITFDASQQIIEKCEKIKYKTVLIRSDKDQPQQIIVSSRYDGEYPSIVQQIEEEILRDFHDFNILRIKIESLVSNVGVPETNTEKKLFWNRTNYFEFHYDAPLGKDLKGERLKKIFNTYRSKNRLNAENLDFSRIQSKQIFEPNFHWINIMRLFNVGREKAFLTHDEILEYSKTDDLPLSSLKTAFIVSDRYFH